VRIALFGSTGQVATEVQRRLPSGATLEVIGRDRADFSDPRQVHDIARTLEADAIINAVAYTAVDKAESEADLARTINGQAVRALGEAAERTGTPLVHISTDYVFPGSGTAAWKPDDATGPLGAYGASKLDGERALGDTGVRHVILRTSWVFSAHGNNFVKTMLRLGAERDRLTIVNDQIGGPTPAADIADACLKIAAALADGHPGGSHHFSGAPDVSWADFAREIFRQSPGTPEIVDIPTSDFPLPAPRPLNSRLDCSTLHAEFGIKRPDWRAGLQDVLRELDAQ
jgi:dTDP-4-dehydrorhamnose reductase